MIYADNAATTKISEAAFTKMMPFLQEYYSNASAPYSFGMVARRAVEKSRAQIAAAIGAMPKEVIFTSGGSESDSWVLYGVQKLFAGEPIHIITSSIEHYAVLNACRALEGMGVEVTYLPVNHFGRVSVDDAKAAIRPHTKLVSIMLVNNEIGTIQPIAEIGRYLRERHILFHTDAVQAVGHIPVNVDELCVDFLTASAHKFNGAKGTGILYQRTGYILPQMVYGGKQEYELRGGTENVAGILAAGYALEENIAAMQATAEKLSVFAQTTVEAIQAKIPESYINGDIENRLPGIINIAFVGISGESLMSLLDLKGICVSTSSACTSGSVEPSHVLKALGLSDSQAKSVIRISYGKYNTMQEVESVISAICSSYYKILGATTK